MQTPSRVNPRGAARRSAFVLMTLLIPCWSGVVVAQNAATPAAPASEPATVLSPFEVDGSRDSRYRAASTLAGARLNTDLKDLASVIDVYTKEFMEDIGALTLEHVLDYANNLEKDTEDTIHGLGNLNISTNNSFRYRIRGLPASRARNYFDFDYPIDAYNTERLDESRGPNAILFGFGSPGGIVNLSTKRPLLTKNLAQLEYVVGTEVDSRVTLDLSRVLVPNRLALRVNGLRQRKTGWREYTFDDIDALHVAVAGRPTEKTLINVEYERFLDTDAVARPLTFWSQTDTWDAAGKPLINTGFANRANTTLNPGLNVATIAQFSGQNYWVFTEQNNTLLNWRGMSRSNRASYTAADGRVYTAFADFRAQALQPNGIVEVNPMGPSTGRHLELDAFFASVQHEFTRDLHVELALMRSFSDWRSRRLPASTLFADPNAFLPAVGAAANGPAAVNPTRNPFAGQYYMETVAQFWRTTIDSLNYRATASYQLPLRESFGRHTTALLWERDVYETRTRSLQEQLLINGVLASPLAANAANGLTRRYYVTNTGNAKEYRNGNVLNPPTPFDLTLSDGTRVTSRLYEMRSAPGDYIKTDDVLMLVAQSQWWQGRVHTIAGIRRDDVDFDDWGSYVADGQGAFRREIANRSVVKFKGNTRNFGAVYHAKPWFSLFANYSTSVGIPGLKVIYPPNGAFMEPTEGEGVDYGFKFSIPRHRVEGSISYYEASSKNETDSQAVESWGVNGSNSFLDGLIGAGFITAAQAAPLRATGTGDTVDSKTKGVELNVTGEISANWNVRFNYSYTERTLQNAFPRVNAWAESTLRPFWQTWNRDNPNTAAADNILDTVTSGANTLRTLIQNFETNLATRTEARMRVTGARPHKANLFTTYSFKDGALRGSRVGGGVRYDSANYAGQTASGDILKGKRNTAVDLMAAHSRRLFGHPVTFQLNLRNAFERDPRVGPSVINESGNWDTLILYPPREITITLRVSY